MDRQRTFREFLFPVPKDAALYSNVAYLVVNCRASFEEIKKEIWSVCNGRGQKFFIEYDSRFSAFHFQNNPICTQMIVYIQNLNLTKGNFVDVVIGNCSKAIDAHAKKNIENRCKTYQQFLYLQRIYSLMIYQE